MMRNSRTRHIARVACALAAVAAATPLVVSRSHAQSRPSPSLAPDSTARGARPIPGPVYEIPGFTRAVEHGTRTRTGKPGANYWVQHARYSIDTRLDPSTNRVTGRE